MGGTHLRGRLGGAARRRPGRSLRRDDARPGTGERDLDTLRLLKDYRGQRESDGAVLFGVYAYVEQPGVVRVGDAFAPLT